MTLKGLFPTPEEFEEIETAQRMCELFPEGAITALNIFRHSKYFKRVEKEDLLILFNFSELYGMKLNQLFYTFDEQYNNFFFKIFLRFLVIQKNPLRYCGFNTIVQFYKKYDGL